MEADALKRIRTVTHCLPKDVEAIQSSKTPLPFDVYSGEPDPTNPYRYIDGYMRGPKNSPWEGYFLWFHLDFNADYPHSIPTMVMRYPMFHPNVSSMSRTVCTGNLSKVWKRSSKNLLTCNRY